jgi:hypothetical protein
MIDPKDTVWTPPKTKCRRHKIMAAAAGILALIRDADRVRMMAMRDR